MLDTKTTKSIDVGYLSENEREQLTILGVFSAGLLHEIKNQLSCFMISCDILKRDQESLSKDSQTALKSVGAAADRMQAIVRDFGSFFQGEKIKLTPLVLNPILESALQSARPDDASHIEIKLQLSNTPRIKGNASRLEQLFLNLILNAIQAMPATGAPHAHLSLLIKTYVTDDAVVVEFTDSGYGFASEIKENLFKPFMTTQRKIGGSGLGLWICKLIVDEHAALIQIKSEPNQGTIVTVAFPKP